MNTIELQVWKNNELRDEELMSENIERETSALEARKKFVTMLADALGDFFPDIVSGRIYLAAGTYRNWRVNIQFRQSTGFIELTTNNVLHVTLGDHYFYGLYSNMSEKFADWLVENSE